MSTLLSGVGGERSFLFTCSGLLFSDIIMAMSVSFLNGFGCGD